MASNEGCPEDKKVSPTLSKLQVVGAETGVKNKNWGLGDGGNGEGCFGKDDDTRDEAVKSFD